MYYGLFYGIVSVSYTHLDVYKRQVKTTYNGTNLTLRFLNPVSVSSSNLSGLRVYVDPGHSAADLVTGGAWNGVRECTITNQIGRCV